VSDPATTTILLTSHWQQGCNDAKDHRPARRPYPDSDLVQDLAYVERVANEGYMNGYRYGLQRPIVHEPTVDEGSEP